MTPIPPVIELRQYTLHAGQRDALIDLFEREFVEPQEALGLRVVGTFRDLDDPNRFVWLRGFAGMADRASGLAAFYDGPVWQRHRAAANATMIDSDNVLLLRPADPQAHADAAGLVTATICPLGASGPELLVAQFERSLSSPSRAAGAQWAVGFVTETRANNFPRLPVREGEAVIVWLTGFADEPAQRRHAAWLAGAPEWAAWCAHLAAAPQTLRLAPTARSAIGPAFVGRPGDFDFLVGRWNVRNRRLKQRHVGSTDWDEFAATHQAWTHLGGGVSVDEMEFPTRGFAGCTVRTLDLAAGSWAIYWINSRVGRLFPPVYGGFCGDRGEFFGDDEDEGRPVSVRFVWERLGADRARWSQAFSLVGGNGWETNWIMEMQRSD
jgi:hypothetical protein